MDAVDAGHSPVTPRQGVDVLHFRDSEHAVEHCEDCGRFHYEPGPFAWEVEFGIDGCFALWVEGGEPLEWCELQECVSGILCDRNVIHVPVERIESSKRLIPNSLVMVAASLR